jgi:hypothetical protein
MLHHLLQNLTAPRHRRQEAPKLHLHLLETILHLRHRLETGAKLQTEQCPSIERGCAGSGKVPSRTKDASACSEKPISCRASVLRFFGEMTGPSVLRILRVCTLLRLICVSGGFLRSPTSSHASPYSSVLDKSQRYAHVLCRYLHSLPVYAISEDLRASFTHAAPIYKLSHTYCPAHCYCIHPTLEKLSKTLVSCSSRRDPSHMYLAFPGVA